mgnify:CR=1 FL=1
MNDTTILAVLGGTTGAARKPPTETDDWRPTPGRKNRKRWCGGHVGREHKPVVEYDHTLKSLTHCGPRRSSLAEDSDRVWHCIHTTVCATCGKVLDLLGANTPCPDRVDDTIPYDWWKKRLNPPIPAAG